MTRVGSGLALELALEWLPVRSRYLCSKRQPSTVLQHYVVLRVQAVAILECLTTFGSLVTGLALSRPMPVILDIAVQIAIWKRTRPLRAAE